MKLKVFDCKDLGGGKSWVLCKGNLMDYLNNLRPEFFEFSVQRKIVSNLYLDDIYSSITMGEPIPPITLTKKTPIVITGDFCEVDGNEIEILDGLQRTYRFWVVKKIRELILSYGCTDFKELVKVMSEDSEGQVIMENSFVTPKFLRSLLEQKGGKTYGESLIDAFNGYEIYLNIWTGLDDADVVRKMLVLNAGQKSVSSIHQYELLFLHFFEKNRLNYNANITLVREREKAFREIQKGNRSVHEYLLSSVIVALQSFIHGKQMRVLSANKIYLDDSNLLGADLLATYFSSEPLSSFINMLDALGVLLCEQDSRYLKWYGKDTVLSGVFGAMGDYSKHINNTPSIEAIHDLSVKICTNKDPFKLSEYYDAYNNKAGNSNLGNVVRKAVFNYTRDLIETGEADWYKHFDKSTRYDEE
ncbi:MAG: hypothetical protein Q4A15_00195 [Prevotellaceae bacterium]|nr:hypothetical protein [Prevotellaceae bacterium]